jgi:septal ring-binding cell division protein DamX
MGENRSLMNSPFHQTRQGIARIAELKSELQNGQLFTPHFISASAYQMNLKAGHRTHHSLPDICASSYTVAKRHGKGFQFFAEYEGRAQQMKAEGTGGLPRAEAVLRCVLGEVEEQAAPAAPAARSKPAMAQETPKAAAPAAKAASIKQEAEDAALVKELASLKQQLADNAAKIAGLQRELAQETAASVKPAATVKPAAKPAEAERKSRAGLLARMKNILSLRTA